MFEASLQREPELRYYRGAAPARREAFGIRQRISAASRPGVWIAREDETVLSGKIRVVVAQIQMKMIAGEGNTGIPGRVSR